MKKAKQAYREAAGVAPPSPMGKITIKMSVWEIDRLDEMAAGLGRSRSATVRLAIDRLMRARAERGA